MANSTALVNYTEIVPATSLENINGAADIVRGTPQRELTMYLLGGTPFKGGYLFACQGRGADLPSELAWISASPPYNTTTLINNFFGRQFSSLNDGKSTCGCTIAPTRSRCLTGGAFPSCSVQEHKPSGALVFTDTVYGFLQGFRPRPVVSRRLNDRSPPLLLKLCTL